MKCKLIRQLFPLSIILAFTLILGTAGHAFTEVSDSTGKADVLVSFTEKPGHAEQTLIQNAGGKVKRNYHVVPTIAASIPKVNLKILRNNPKITSVEDDITVQIMEETLTWGVDRIDAELVHDQNKGQGVKVAILDTGIDLEHPDLRIAGNVTFVPETVNGDDDNGHGTMVAGVVAALDNDIGIVGVAPEVELYSVKVLNSNGSGLISIILAGIEWAIENNMQVINISFGGILNWPSSIIEALEKANQSGIVIVAGAGNSGDRGIIYSPARYEPVIAVGATDQQDIRASFSCTGPELELMAPGVDIISTSRGGGYASVSGTSFSTPHVTGIAALLIASGVTSNTEVRQILQSTADDFGTSGWDSCYGYGLVNTSRAINESTNNQLPDDEVPPASRIDVTGLQGNQGWYRSDVTIALVAEDNPGGSGIAKIQYSLDSGQTWQSYCEPFVIAQEGIYTIQASFRDNACNMAELLVSREVRIDKSGPDVDITVYPSTVWPENHKETMVDVLVTSFACDELSGLTSFQLAVKDEYGEVEPVMEPVLQQYIQLAALRNGPDLDGRIYTIIITATDHAGNTATAETIVTVPHDNREKVKQCES